jgi:LysR substrate binding domain-containing protein
MPPPASLFRGTRASRPFRARGARSASRRCRCKFAGSKRGARPRLGTIAQARPCPPRSKSPDRASDILSAVRDLADCARRANGVLTGTLRLGVIPTLALYVLPRVLPAQARRFRRLRLDLQEAQIRLLLQELIRGTLDAMLLAPPVDPPALETLPLFGESFPARASGRRSAARARMGLGGRRQCASTEFA